MVIIGIPASGPPQNGHAEFPEVIHCLLAIAIDIGNRRFLADPQTAVNTRAKMLGKMTVKFRANDANFPVSAHDNFLRGCGGGKQASGNECRERESCGASDELPTR